MRFPPPALLAAGWLLAGCLALGGEPARRDVDDGAKDPVGQAVASYFSKTFERLRAVAELKPTPATFRKAMEPAAEGTAGFFGGSLTDADFVIREVYRPRDFLARGYDLKKVAELADFWKRMREKPAEQLSEPSKAGVMQPSLISMRCPVLADGKLAAVVCMMVRTEAFLKAVGLEGCRGYRIVCQDKEALVSGDLEGELRKIDLELPSTRWTIEYKP